ncbi:MAG: glycyl-radical enzyme activating protein [Clostridiales bacterium]|nr:glycyl-radical enzyme activating protein [Clostridiales bacterium]
MKAKIFEIKRFAVHDGDGIRTTVFFKGCPLKCVWCHNPEGLCEKPELAYYEHKCISCGECLKVCPSNAHKIENGLHIFERDKCLACGKCESVCLGNALTLYGKEYTVSELVPILLKDKDFYDNSGGGVTLSGGECLLYADFCAELLKQLKERGVNTAVDTCGFVSKTALDKVIPYTDTFLYDIKAMSEERHEKSTGRSNKKIIENLLYLDNKGCKIEIRIPYVPNFNDLEIEGIGKFLSKLKNVTKVRVLSYHNFASSKYESLGIKNNLPNDLPSKTEIDSAIKTLKSFGLNVV